MVAHINRCDLPPFRQAFGNHPPVAGGTEQPMRNQQRRAGGGGAKDQRVQHVTSLLPARPRPPDPIESNATPWHVWHMTPQELTPHIDDIRRLLETQLRVRGATLAKQVQRAGRQLPRKIRTEAAFLVQANMLVQNPKLARMISPDRTQKAAETVATYLRGIDPRDRLKGRILNIAGILALNLLLVGGLVVVVLVWRGIV